MHLFIREPKIAETLEKKTRFQPLKTYPAEANMLVFPGFQAIEAERPITTQLGTALASVCMSVEDSWFHMVVSYSML